MLILNKIRYLVWYIIEQLKTDSIYKRKKIIEKCMKDDLFYKEYLKKKLSEITEYASSNTKFYSVFKGKNISEYPVINKSIIMKNMNEFKSREFTNKKTHIMATSGSTGIPFRIEQDMGKRKQVLAEIIYFSNLVGYEVGKKIVYLRNLEAMFQVPKYKQFIKNENIIATQKYDDETISKIVNKLICMEKGTTILGYASTLQIVSSYMKKNNIKAENVNGIISGAEAITTKTRKLVEEQFKCNVVSRYSNQEMGILAQDFEEDKFLLNRASYYFELLALDKDEPAKLGEMGRIVVTDLYNYAMPMLRYDTGDLGIMLIDKNGREYLAKVFGRKLDLLYTTNNEPISFFALDEYFEDNFDIEQFQIIQEDRDKLIVNLIMKNDKKVDEKWCKEKIKDIMGQDCNIEINYLNQLPITNSGKFRYVICNYKPNIK